MAHAENSITIDRPVDVVFAFVQDGKNNPRWRPSVTDIQLVAGKPVGVGAIFKQGLKGPGGRRIDGDYEIIESKPNELIKFQVVAGPARPMGSYKFESVGNATRMTFSMHSDPKGLMAKLMDGMVNKQMQVEVGMLSNLKACLEEGVRA